MFYLLPSLLFCFLTTVKQAASSCALYSDILPCLASQQWVWTILHPDFGNHEPTQFFLLPVILFKYFVTATESWWTHQSCKVGRVLAYSWDTREFKSLRPEVKRISWESLLNNLGKVALQFCALFSYHEKRSNSYH